MIVSGHGRERPGMLPALVLALLLPAAAAKDRPGKRDTFESPAHKCASMPPGETLAQSISRFTTLRDNHDRLLSQMTELNAALKKERIERTGLQQQLQAAEVRARTRMRARRERTHAAHHERSSHTFCFFACSD